MICTFRAKAAIAISSRALTIALVYDIVSLTFLKDRPRRSNFPTDIREAKQYTSMMNAKLFLLMHIENTIPKWKTYVVLMCNTTRNIGA